METNHFNGIVDTNISFPEKNSFDRLLKKLTLRIFLSALRGSIVHCFLCKINSFVMSLPLATGPHSLFYELADV